MSPAPANRTLALTESRENLARALSRFEQLSHSLIEAVSQLRKERSDLDSRIGELESLLEQERTNNEQRERLSASSKKDLDARAAEFEKLHQTLRERTETIDAQQASILELEEKLEAMRAEADGEARMLIESKTSLEVRADDAERRATALQAEIDELKAALSEKEKEDAQWALKLTRDDSSKAVDAIDKILGRVEKLEATTNGTNS